MNPMRTCATAIVAALALQPAMAADPVGSTPAAQADIDFFKDPAKNAKLFSFDYGIPESPALTLAGLSSDKVKPATTLKPFVLALPGLFDGSGTGSAALDISPAWLLDPDATVGDSTSLPVDFDYGAPGNYLDRVLARARLGIVAYRGDDGGGDVTKSKPSLLAVGLSFSLADGSDPVTAGSNVGIWLNDRADTAWNACIAKNQDLLAPTAMGAAYGQLSNDITVLLDFAPGAIPGPPTFDRALKQSIRDIEGRYYTRAGLSAPAVAARIAELDASFGDTQATWVARARADRVLLLEENKKFIDASPDVLKVDQKIAALTDCKKEASAAAEHGADLQIGAGVVWSGTPGKLQGFADANEAFYASGRYSLDSLFGHAWSSTDCTKDDKRHLSALFFSCWMIGGSGRYSHGQMVSTGNAGTPEFKADITEGWIGLERVSDKFKLGAFVGYLDQSAEAVADKPFESHGTRWLVTGAISLDRFFGSGSPLNGAWLVGSYGAANGSVTTLDDKVALLSLTFAPPTVSSDFDKK